MPAVISPNVPEEIRARLTEILTAVAALYPEELVDTFASHGDEDGAPGRQFDSLWMFTEHYFGEVRNPLANPQRLNFDVAPLKNSVDWLRLNAREYPNMAGATETSRLELEFSTTDGLSGTLYAVGADCDRLMEIYRSYFQANLVSGDR